MTENRKDLSYLLLMVVGFGMFLAFVVHFALKLPPGMPAAEPTTQEPSGPEFRVGPQFNMGPRVNLQNGQIEVGPNLGFGPHLQF